MKNVDWKVWRKRLITATVSHVFPFVSGIVFLFVILFLSYEYVFHASQLDNALAQQVGVGLAALSIPGMWTILGPLQEKRNQLSHAVGYSSEEALLHLNRRVYIWQACYAVAAICIFGLLVFPDYLTKHVGLFSASFTLPLLLIILPISLADMVDRITKPNQTGVFAHLLLTDPSKFIETLRELLIKDDSALYELSIDPRKFVLDLLNIVSEESTPSDTRASVLRTLAETLEKRSMTFLLVQDKVINVAATLYLKSLDESESSAALNYGSHQLIQAALRCSIDARLADLFFREIKRVWEASGREDRSMLLFRTIDMLMHWVRDATSKKEFVYAPDAVPEDWTLEITSPTELSEFKRQLLNGLGQTLGNRWTLAREEVDFALHTMFEGFFPSLYLIDFVPLYFLTIGLATRFMTEMGWKAGFASGLGTAWSGANEEDFEQNQAHAIREQKDRTYKVLQQLGDFYGRPWTAGRCELLISELTSVETRSEQEERNKNTLIATLTSFKEVLSAGTP